MLKKLEQDNIIYRRQDDQDSRTTKVYLTENGKALKEPINEMWKKHEDQMFHNILPEELLLMRRVLKQISDNLSNITD